MALEITMPRNTFIRSLNTFFYNLRIVRKSLGQVLFWPVAAVILGIVGWSFLFARLEESKRDTVNASLREAVALSKGYADHLSRTLEEVDQSILHVRYEWELTKGHLHLENAKQRGLFAGDNAFNVAIIDRNGFIVTSTYADLRDPAHKRSLAARPYFRVQQNAEKDFLHIGEPYVGVISRQNRIRFTRRLRDRNGQFDGIILFSVPSAYFSANYDNTTLGNHGFLGVLGQDGVTLVTRIGQRVYTPGAQALVALPALRLPSGSALLDGNRWFADKRSRIVGWQLAPGYPMIALVGLDQHDTLVPYSDRRASSIYYAGSATFALGLFALIGMTFSLRLAWRKREIEVIQDTYRKATEEGSEGFYIFRPVRTHDGAIHDFEVIDCNRRGAEFFCLPHRDLIGTRASSLFSREAFEDLAKRLQQALNLGFYESDIEIPGDWPVSASWVHLKIARSQDDLALTLLDISASKAHVDELERRGNEDPMTGLPNRHWLQAYLDTTVESAAGAGSMLALLFVDVDGFKLVNDTLGHAAGDEVLRITARRMRLALRPEHHLARLGSDEFVAILEDIESKQDVARVAKRVLQAFDESFQLIQGERTLSASIGISIFPDDGTDAGTLLRNADIAMHSVKQTGKGSYLFFDPVFYERLRIRVEKELELREAIEKDQFVMYYQPRLDVATGTVSSMEALVRWMHPQKGLIGPGEFIPLAEETGLIVALGEMVLEKVCAQIASWEGQHLDLVPVSVNVSPRQFYETDVSAIFSKRMKSHRIDPALIEIEVTESSMMKKGIDISAIVNRLHGIGVKLSIDDFGTGYSSLSQLQRMDFDVLKIDIAFTTEIEKTEAGKVFVTAIITMAHALGMRVVAEGVENEAQLAILRSLRCDEIQGFYVSPPVPPSESRLPSAIGSA